MSILGLSFLTPLALFGLALLPVIYWLLKVRPPQPRRRVFPPLRLLKRLKSEEQQSHTTPWWLLLLRLVLFALIVFATAQPFLGQRTRLLAGDGPVIVAIDDTWAAAKAWDARLEGARLLTEEAAARGITLRLMTTASGRLDPAQALNPGEALERLDALEPLPRGRNGAMAAAHLDGLGEEVLASHSLIWLSDGLSDPSGLAADLAERFSGRLTVLGPRPDELPRVIRSVTSSNSGFTVNASGLASPPAPSVVLRDEEGRVLSEAVSEATENGFAASFDLPVAVENRISRIDLAGENHAGATWLIGTGDKRIQAAVITGGGEKPQPLLSPSHYITNAFGPDVDLLPVAGENFIQAVEAALQAQSEAIIMTGTGPLPQDAVAPLTEFLEAGGVVIRFADKALAGRDDGLMPGVPHTDLRVFGGQLSWGEQPGLGTFSSRGPLGGLDADPAVSFRAQLLTRGSAEDGIEPLATLSDGTPLVSMKSFGPGRLVFIHVAADPLWSNLPASPLFARMMQRLVKLTSFTGTGEGKAGTLAPYLLLDGFGSLEEPGAASQPVDFSAALPANATPGYYGPEGALSLNLMEVQPAPQRLSLPPRAASLVNYPTREGLDLRPHFIAAAALLFLIDTLLMAFIGGRLGRRTSAAALALLLIPIMGQGEARAQLAADWEATLTPRLAYMLTGNADYDEVAAAGLFGLSQMLGQRTALELGEPVGLNPADDELGFYPFIYWAVPPDAAPLSEDARDNVARFLDNGGTVLFDTRDQNANLGAASMTPGAQGLQRLLDELALPRLAPVPDNHVLTRSFYLISQFPGRFEGSPLWTEASIDQPDRLTRTGDGVSPILITANDMAGAWAIDQYGRALLPMQTGDEFQREMAYRAGINIVMYAFTGNYKADQVHLPDILRRLGQ